MSDSCLTVFAILGWGGGCKHAIMQAAILSVYHAMQYRIETLASFRFHYLHTHIALQTLPRPCI